MTEDNPLMRELMEKVADQLTRDLRDSLAKAVERELSKTLSAALLEGEFYRRVNDDLQKAFKDIYSEIKAAKSLGPNLPTIDEDPGELFSKASNQLDAILQTTENATVKIIDAVERLQPLSDSLSGIVASCADGHISAGDREALSGMSDAMSRDLMNIMTALSFQDLTGQRIKIIIDTIKKIEKIVLDVYMTTGLMIQARSKSPQDTDFTHLQAQARDKLSELKGPQEEADQGAVDDLLASLGL